MLNQIINQSINQSSGLCCAKKPVLFHQKSRQFLSPPKFYFGKRPHTKKSTPGLFLAKQPQIKKKQVKRSASSPV